MLDSHQDLLTRFACGEGIPDFYAHEIWEKAPKYLIGAFDDVFIVPILRMFNIPTSMEDYDYAVSSEGVPLQSECL